MAEDGIDVYAWAHNETSTAVMAPVQRPSRHEADEALVLVDATSGAGGLPVDLAETDVYYFAPQKSFASDGGLWIAIMSPAAARAGGPHRRERPPRAGVLRPAHGHRQLAARTRPTTPRPWPRCSSWPSSSTAMNAAGGLPAMVERTTASSGVLYDWAERTPYATPYVADPEHRSLVIATINLDEAIDAPTVSAVLRAHGVVDTEPYRKLGQNQLRIGTYPAVDAADVEALTRCIDHVVAAMGWRRAPPGTVRVSAPPARISRSVARSRAAWRSSGVS